MSESKNTKANEVLFGQVTDQTMLNKILFVSDVFVTVNCVVKNTGVYSYLATKELAATLSKGDLVVVQGQYENSLMIVTVDSVDTDVNIVASSSLHYKWIVSRIDVTQVNHVIASVIAAYDKVVAANKVAVRNKMREELMESEFGDAIKGTNLITIESAKDADDVEVKE